MGFGGKEQSSGIRCPMKNGESLSLEKCIHWAILPDGESRSIHVWVLDIKNTKDKLMEIQPTPLFFQPNQGVLRSPALCRVDHVMRLFSLEEFPDRSEGGW